MALTVSGIQDANGASAETQEAVIVFDSRKHAVKLPECVS